MGIWEFTRNNARILYSGGQQMALAKHISEG